MKSLLKFSTGWNESVCLYWWIRKRIYKVNETKTIKSLPFSAHVYFICLMSIEAGIVRVRLLELASNKKRMLKACQSGCVQAGETRDRETSDKVLVTWILTTASNGTIFRECQSEINKTCMKSRIKIWSRSRYICSRHMYESQLGWELDTAIGSWNIQTLTQIDRNLSIYFQKDLH